MQQVGTCIKVLLLLVSGYRGRSNTGTFLIKAPPINVLSISLISLNVDYLKSSLFFSEDRVTPRSVESSRQRRIVFCAKAGIFSAFESIASIFCFA